jgi:3-dehydroquinate synthase
LKKINIKSKSFTYPVFIGSNILQSLPLLLEKHKLYKNVFIVIDENVEKIYGKEIRKLVNRWASRNALFILKASERSKSLMTLKKIYTALADDEFGRDTLLLSVGGGITGDVAGCCAATYMRGVQLVHVPTTLLASVDSSIGGKTGVNFYNRKNLIGSFYQPQFVIIDTGFLQTLPAAELKSGAGEIIKYAFLSNKDFYNYILQNFNELLLLNNKVLSKVISESVLIKAGVVSQDEKETRLRKILNFGHTFAHAFESHSGYKIKHGEAVVGGILAALFLSHKLKFFSDEKLESYLKFLSVYKLPSAIKKVNNNIILELMRLDKKKSGDRIKFVLLKDIGNLVIDAEIEKKEIFYALEKMKEFSSVLKGKTAEL